MSHCKTCKHWEPAAAEAVKWNDTKLWSKGGFCRSDKFSGWSGMPSVDGLIAMPEDGNCVAVWTGPDFGCVHHEKSEM